MNSCDTARIEYIKEQEADAIQASLSALIKANKYCHQFNANYEMREIRRASERAHWINIVLPALRKGKGVKQNDALEDYETTMELMGKRLKLEVH